MEYVRYFRNEKIPCKPWDAIMDYYEDKELEAEPDFDLNYSDSQVSVKSRREFHETLASRGDPGSHSANIWFKKPKSDALTGLSTHWMNISLLDAASAQVEVTALDTRTADEAFDLLGRHLKLEFCAKEETLAVLLQKVAFQKKLD